jgi:hypothetical protein
MMKMHEIFLKRKNAMVESATGKLLIGIAFLLVMILIIALIKGKLGSLWEGIKGLFRFG